LNGKTITVDVEKGDSIDDVKAKIAEKVSVVDHPVISTGYVPSIPSVQYVKRQSFEWRSFVVGRIWCGN